MPGKKPICQCTDAEWKEIVARVRSSCPPPEGYAWRFMRCTKIEVGTRGNCARKEPDNGKPGVITIRILRGYSESETADIMIHEVAHAYDMWTHHAWGGDHGDVFFVWLGRVYRRYWAET